MNSDVLKGKWLQMKGEVLRQWGKLTNDDLDQIEGNAETLVRRLQERYGYPRQLVLLELGNFLQTQK
jgi:uncharacterized protein YjbJ (UPF0337 family)